MGIIDKIATVVADKVNAQNDEVMLLTQENEKLQREYDAKAYTVIQLEKKNENLSIDLGNLRIDWNDLDEEHNRLESKYTEVKKRLKDLSERGERQVDVINEYSERIIELEKSNKAVVLTNARFAQETAEIQENNSRLTSDKKLKQRNKELEKLLKDSEDLIEANTIYRMTYEYISDEANRQMVIDNFSHNLSKWISDKNLTDTEIAKKLGTSRNIVGNLRTGNRAVNVNTIQKFDIELCEYFECSVYELVTVKMEKSEDRRSDCDVVK